MCWNLGSTLLDVEPKKTVVKPNTNNIYQVCKSVTYIRKKSNTVDIWEGPTYTSGF